LQSRPRSPRAQGNGHGDQDAIVDGDRVVPRLGIVDENRLHVVVLLLETEGRNHDGFAAGAIGIAGHAGERVVFRRLRPSLHVVTVDPQVDICPDVQQQVAIGIIGVGIAESRQGRRRRRRGRHGRSRRGRTEVEGMTHTSKEGTDRKGDRHVGAGDVEGAAGTDGYTDNGHRAADGGCKPVVVYGD